MQTIISAAFHDPYSAARASNILRSHGIACKYQLGTRVVQRTPPCPNPPSQSAIPTPVVPVPSAAPTSHPAAVLNMVVQPHALARARKVIAKFDGREI